MVIFGKGEFIYTNILDLTHSANQSILKNNDPEHPTLSQQYKNLLKQVHQEISNRTHNQLKDFAKHNPEVKQSEEATQIRTWSKFKALASF